MVLPMTTAREYPTISSHLAPEEMFLRIVVKFGQVELVET
jgi:hypothetical protein